MAFTWWWRWRWRWRWRWWWRWRWRWRRRWWWWWYYQPTDLPLFMIALMRTLLLERVFPLCRTFVSLGEYIAGFRSRRLRTDWWHSITSNWLILWWRGWRSLQVLSSIPGLVWELKRSQKWSPEAGICLNWRWKIKARILWRFRDAFAIISFVNVLSQDIVNGNI